MRKYELMTIFPAEEEKYNAGLATLRSTLSEYGVEIEKEEPICSNCGRTDKVISIPIELYKCLGCGEVTTWSNMGDHMECEDGDEPEFELLCQNAGVEFYCEGRDCRGEFEPLYLGCEEYFEECPDCIYGMIYE